MKKFIYILCIALFAVACVDPLEQVVTITNEPADGAKMTLEFSIPTSPLTKGGMTDQPNITTSSKVHVLVFNATSGALLQVAEASLKEGESVTQNTTWSSASSPITDYADFTVVVDMGSAHRFLQVVVDAPTYTTDGTNDNETGIGYASNPIYIGDSETDVASKLYTQMYTQDNVTYYPTSYWQRIDLPNGLQAYTYPGGKPEKGVEGVDWTYVVKDPPIDPTEDYYTDKNNSTVYYGDFVNGSGHKITTGTGYVMSTDVANRVKFIPLVRNFVKIRVSKAEGGNFTPSKAVLINVPKSGYIAPYSAASGFVSYYLKDEKLDHLQKPATPVAGEKYGEAGIISTGYTAPVPNDEIDTSNPGEAKCISADNGVISLYMYERGVPTSNPTQLLVYGSLNGTNRWLKMDITDTDGNYIALYRDLTYDMKIGSITGTSGYTSIGAAYNGTAIGNPSASPETKTLTQVSDGKGTYIWVDYIDYASFDANANTTGVRLRYKFWNSNATYPKTSADAVVTVSHSTSPGAVTSTTLTPQVYSGTDTQDQESGWYYVNVPLAAQTSTVMRSVVRVSGTAVNTAGKTVTLYRDVTFTVMPMQTMTVEMSKLESDAYDKPTTATITLPDGLGYSLFPLVIRIEAYNGSLNPSDSDLPVGYGTSTFKTLTQTNNPDYATYSGYVRSSNSLWFEKTIDYDDYDSGTREFTADFTTIFSSGNPTVVAFSDPDGHFYTRIAPLTL